MKIPEVKDQTVGFAFSFFVNICSFYTLSLHLVAHKLLFLLHNIFFFITLCCLYEIFTLKCVSCLGADFIFQKCAHCYLFHILFLHFHFDISSMETLCVCPLVLNLDGLVTIVIRCHVTFGVRS